MAGIQSPQDLFLYNLCAIYDVEQKLTQVLPTLAQEAQNPQVREAFTEHLQETQQHVRNLEQCFQIVGRQPMQLETYAVTGLKQDHDAFLQQQPSPEALTMFDIVAGSKSEYLEMAAYSALIVSANSLGWQQCIPLFQENLQQEEAAAKKLAALGHQIGQVASPK